MENVTLNPKEQTRLQVLNSLLAEHMTLDQAATLMGVSTRHTRRMLAAYREKGAASVAHGHRGRRAPNATPEAVAYDVVHLARTRYSGANHTHLSELLDEREGIDIGRTTLRRILVNAGLKSPQRRRPPKHRVRRQRMPRQGMMIQMDGSHHPWLGDQVPPFTLLIAVDDATGTVAHALFCAKEEAYTYFLLIQDLVQRVGIPIALYVDRHGVFRHTPGSGLPGDVDPVQPGHGRDGDTDDIRPLAPSQGPRGAGCGNLPGPAGYRTPVGGRQQHQGSQRGAGAVSATIQPALPGSPAML